MESIDQNQKLPIGTVVLLKGGKRKLMIVGFDVASDSKKNEVWDFAACPFPEGILSSNKILFFNRENIEKVCYLGLIDDEVEKFENFREKILSVTEGIEE